MHSRTRLLFRSGGSVLILVAWGLVLLVLIAGTLARQTFVEIESSNRRGLGLLARTIAESGIETTIARLVVEPRAWPDFQAPWRDNPDLYDRYPMEGGDYSLFYYDSFYEERRFGVVPEAGKLNINIADADQLEMVIGYIMEEMGVLFEYAADEFADAIIDFRDDNDNPREFGAEIEYYSFLDPPYEPKNGPFETMAELLLVRGIDEVLLYGEDTNRNGRLDGNEDDGSDRYPLDDGDGILDLGLIHFLTCVTFDLNVTAEGLPRVDLNADAETIEAALTEVGVDAGLISDLLEYKEQVRNFSSIGQLVDTPDWEAGEVQAVIDYVTVGEEPSFFGRIDVSSAPAIVLATLPGLDEETADALVAAREGRTEGLDSIGWTLDVLEPEQFRGAAPFMTARSYQYEIRAIGEVHDGRIFHRTRVIVDLMLLEEVGPRFIHRQDETYLGPVFSRFEQAERTLLLR